MTSDPAKEGVAPQGPASGEQKQSKVVYYSTGRGGAGNIKSSAEAPVPHIVREGSNTPKLTTTKITTGRGGYGNMVNNDSPELARKLQDVEQKKSPELKAVTSNLFTVGRGGFGNVVSKTRSNGSSTGSGNNLYTVISLGAEKHHKKNGFVNKVKSLFS